MHLKPSYFADTVKTVDDLNSCLSECKPLALWNARLEKTGGGDASKKKGWDDVGGLEAVKKALVETVLWPGKVTLFPRSSLLICCTHLTLFFLLSILDCLPNVH